MSSDLNPTSTAPAPSGSPSPVAPAAAPVSASKPVVTTATPAAKTPGSSKSRKGQYGKKPVNL